MNFVFGDETPPIRVFAHLAHGFGAEEWRKGVESGKIIGINELRPYGYFRAEQFGCSVDYSHDRVETFFQKYFRFGVRWILGFDLVHAWRNLDGIRDAEIIWTHTESQYLSILLLLWFSPQKRRPKIIAQTVWLFDKWGKLNFVRKFLFSRLILRADLLTVLSSENLKVARSLFPGVPSRMFWYGVYADLKIEPKLRSRSGPLNLIALGNDEHRDWKFLVEAIGNQPQWKLKIASAKIDPRLVMNMPNIEIVRPRSNEELFALYDWADILVMAIKPNLHASGITVIQESALLGVPVVCTDVGGLKAYFADHELRYVPIGDIAAFRQAIRELETDPAKGLAMAERAQARMGSDDLSSQSYARQHAEASKELLQSRRAAVTQ